MFGLLNSQIYELQQTELKNNNNNNNISKNHHQHNNNNNQQEKMKVTTNFIEKFIIKSEVIAGNTIPVDLKNSFDTMKHFKNHNQQQQQQNHLSSLINNNHNNNNCNSNSKGGGQNQDVGINDNIPAVTLKSKELNVKQEKMLTKDIDNNRAVINRSGSSSSSSNYCEGNGIKNNNDKKLKRNLLNGEINGNGNYKSNNNNDKENLNKTTNNLVESSKSPTTSELSGINSDSNTKTTNSTIPAVDIMQRKKFMQMITFLDQQNQRLEKELAKEKRRRAEELSRIIKSLLCFEAKLKSEKKVINQKLYDKDDEIAKLVRLNRILRKQCFKIDESIECTEDEKEINNIEDITNNGITTDDGGGDGEECKYPEALFCPNCRKEFYGLDVKEIGKDGRIIKGDHHHNGSTEHGSSSDETLSSSFYGARRSIRYTSKRTFGTFRDYMRSRCLNIDDPNLDNSEENASILSRDESQTSYEKMNYSRTIDRIHGVRRVSSFEFDSENSENRSRKNFSSSGPETDHDHSPHEEVDEEDDVFYPTQTNFTKNSQRNEFIELSSIMPQVQKFETSTDDWYASASDQDDEQDINVRTTKSYGYNVGVNPVLECVNQILLQQSMEECLINNNNNDNSANSSGEINAVSNNGPTSLDSNDNNSGGSINGGNLSGGSTASKDNSGTGTRKRVHFSTKNSMVHVPRNDDDDDDSINMLNHHTISSNTVVLIDQKSCDQNFNYESIYSNEYEPIGSEHNSSNLYVDMDGSKLGQDDQQRCNELNKHLKQPPALPPKPANLIKFKRSLKNNLPSNQEDLEHQQQIACNLIDDSVKLNNIIEPDYCSISELSENLTTCVQIVADVHKIPENVLSSSSSSSSSSSASSLCGSSITSDTEIFADIPKLPNVAAIIAPKQNNNNNNNNKFINNDNYVTKSSSPKKDDSLVTSISSTFVVSPTQQQQQQQHFRPKSPGQVKRQHVPNILAEINKKIQNSNNNNGILNPLLSPTKSSHHNNLITIPMSPKKLNNPLHHHQLTPILKQRNQQSHQKISSPKSSLTDDQQNKLQIQEEFDWYNLDAEYGKSSLSSSVIKSSDNIKSDILNLNEMDELILSNNTTGGNNNNDNLNNPNDSIEYNLDEEFSLCNQTDDLLIHENDKSIHENVMENINNNDDNDAGKNDLITTNLENGFATIIDDTPANRKNVKRKENFVKFIDTAGLSTKPLPRQRKIYFSGPFI